MRKKIKNEHKMVTIPHFSNIYRNAIKKSKTVLKPQWHTKPNTPF